MEKRFFKTRPFELLGLKGLATMVSRRLTEIKRGGLHHLLQVEGQIEAKNRSGVSSLATGFSLRVERSDGEDEDNGVIIE